MELNSEDQHVVKIREVSQVQLASMEEKLLATPKLLTTSAGQTSCCIFRVPQSQVNIQRYAYLPHIISIGPYHYGKENLKMIQEHKWRFLSNLLSRTRNKGLGLEDYLKAIKLLEDRARECYSEVVNLSSDEFVEIMVLDACFIIEFFRVICKVVQTDANDPIFAMPWVLPFLFRDFVKLENQIPFFVLQCLFDLSKMPQEETESSLVSLALKSFDFVLDRPDEVIEQYESHYGQDGKHLLGILRSSFIPKTLSEWPLNANSTTETIHCVSKLRGAWIKFKVLLGILRSSFIPKTLSNRPPNTEPIHCVSKLLRAGIKFKVGDSNSFLDIRYQHGVIEMPSISINDFTCSFFLNCIAFEQCYRHCSKHVTTYATTMDCLIDTFKDVDFLCEAGIIENYFGHDEEVSRFFNILGKEVSLDISRCYLTNLFNEVNEYYKDNRHVQWASFKYTYFRTPWSFISALAALVLLVLTVAQTFYTVYPYYRSS